MFFWGDKREERVLSCFVLNFFFIRRLGEDQEIVILSVWVETFVLIKLRKYNIVFD